jgi:hypothetical protein
MKTVLLIRYDQPTDQLIATLSEEQELKVGYCLKDNLVSVIKKDKVLTTAKVRENFPARAFIDYCFNTAKLFSL